MPSGEVFDILFPLEKSIRYHQRRCAFYGEWHRWLMFIIIVAGSTAATDVFPQLQKVLALLTAALGAMDLVFGLSDKARDHEVLMRKFASLVSQIRRRDSPTQSDIDAWQAERVEIEADEPATYWALEAICYNEVADAFDRNPADRVRIPWYYQISKNYVHFDPTRFKFIGPIQ